MFGGMNPRDLQKAMQKLGVKQTEIDAIEVIIRTQEKDIVISNPNVSKVNMMGQESFQISGAVSERARKTEADITDEDIKTVAEQANVSKDKAKKALQESKGDLAEAILKLSS